MLHLYLTRDDFLTELNLQLERHEAYEEPMKFVAYPLQTVGSAMTGYKWIGPKNKRAIFEQVASRVSCEHHIRHDPKATAWIGLVV